MRTRSDWSRPSARFTSPPASDSGLTLHGYIDRLDLAPTGELRIVDYKTGRSPGEQFEAKALFQMKFYALVVWRTRGVIPAMLQLVYLGNAEMLRYRPDEADLLATERKVEALWAAIQRAPPRPGVAAQQVGTLRLVRPPGAVPGVGRHAAAAAGEATVVVGRRHGDRPSPVSSRSAAGRSVEVAGDLDVAAGRSADVLPSWNVTVDPLRATPSMDSTPVPERRVRRPRPAPRRAA